MGAIAINQVAAASLCNQHTGVEIAHLVVEGRFEI